MFGTQQTATYDSLTIEFCVRTLARASLQGVAGVELVGNGDASEQNVRQGTLARFDDGNLFVFAMLREAIEREAIPSPVVRKPDVDAPTLTPRIPYGWDSVGL